ncbi:MAG: MGMT family protein [Armatimonadetes bacterium]|nr:MGMT family protein [Armatimonadota bacterium]
MRDDADALLRAAADELRRFFTGQATQFGVELDLGGVSDFTRRVLTACAVVPYGRTSTYGELAATIGAPRAARAVGRALHSNPLAIVVPCHRIIGADGSLVGFGGGLDMKRRLLALEARADRDVSDDASRGGEMGQYTQGQTGVAVDRRGRDSLQCEPHTGLD